MIYLNASAARFMHCGRAFHLGIIEGWKPSTVGNNITFGTAFHLYAHLKALGDIFAIAKAVEFYGKEPCTITHNKLTKQHLIDVCAAHSVRSSPYVVINDGMPNAASELKFHIPVNNEIVFCGTIDNLVTDSNGLVYIRDYKTTSSNPAGFFNHFLLSNQFIAYQLAIRTHQRAFPDSPLASYKIAGIVIEAIFLSSANVKFETSQPFIHSDETLDFYQEQLETFKVPENKPHGKFNGTCRTCQFSNWCNGFKEGYIRQPYSPVGD